jgi:hypothetical protein
LIFPAYWLTRDWNWAGILLSDDTIFLFHGDDVTPMVDICSAGR